MAATTLFLNEISTGTTSSSSSSSSSSIGSFNTFLRGILGLLVLELVTIYANLALLLVFLFVVSTRKVLVHVGRVGFDKDGSAGNATPISPRVDAQVHEVRIGMWFKLTVLSSFYVLLVQVVVLGFDGAALIRGRDKGKPVDLSLISLLVVQGLAWPMLAVKHPIVPYVAFHHSTLL